jgi:hypothetical protein
MSKEAAVNLGLAFLGLTGAYRTAIEYRLACMEPSTMLSPSGSMFCKVSVFDKGCNRRFGKISDERGRAYSEPGRLDPGERMAARPRRRKRLAALPVRAPHFDKIGSRIDRPKTPVNRRQLVASARAAVL